MLQRFLAAVVLLSTLAFGQQVADARVSRQEHKAKPMLERSYRVGHFYGNTVRRNAKPDVMPNRVGQDLMPETDSVRRNAKPDEATR